VSAPEPSLSSTGGPPTAAAKSVFPGRFTAASDTKRRWGRGWNELPKTTRWLITLLIIVFIYLLPSLNLPILPTQEADFTSLLAGTIVPYIMIALGLNVVVGMAGMLDLGYVGFYAVGAYSLAVLTTEHASVPWLLAVFLSIIISMFAGVLLGAPTLRLRGDYLAIVTLGFGEIIRLLAQETDWLGGSFGINNIKSPPDIGPLKFTGPDRNLSFYYLAVTFVIIVYFLLHRLEDSRVGRAWTAIREDEDAAELMGVPTFRFKLWAFAIGAAVGGLAGTMFASKARFIIPDNFELKLSILFLAAVVLGGPGNQIGVMVGAFLVSYLPERLRFLNTSRYFWFGVLLMVMMIFRPQGLIPRRLKARKLKKSELQEFEEDDTEEGFGDEVVPTFVDVREGSPDLEGGARGTP
jgi:branched-chain amino acid transport system permease protein